MIKLHTLCYIVGLPPAYSWYNGRVVEVIGPCMERRVQGGKLVIGYLCEAEWLREMNKLVPNYVGTSIDQRNLLPIAEPPVCKSNRVKQTVRA